jgi:hypothetical protein
MMTSDEKCKKEGLMTRKLLLTAAIVALAFAPSIGTGTAQARGFFGADSGAAFTADSGAASMADSGAAFMADSVFSIGAITAMAISPTATTVTDRLRLAT